jgi:hypothetical protein
LFLLISCSSVNQSGNNKEKRAVKGQIVITIKIVGNLSDEHRYLLSLTTNGKQKKETAQFPESRLIITNDKKIAHVKFHTNSKYVIKVSKTEAKNIKEFFQGKKNGKLEDYQTLATVDFTPTQDSDNLDINVQDD